MDGEAGQFRGDGWRRSGTKSKGEEKVTETITGKEYLKKIKSTVKQCGNGTGVISQQ